MKLSRTCRLAGLGLVVALASFAGDPDVRAVAEDREIEQLRLQLRDCAGPSCVPQRDRLIARLREQTRSCSGDACDPLHARLREQQQLRNCDAAGDPCTALRQEVRQREQHRMRMPAQPGQGRGGGAGGRN